MIIIIYCIICLLLYVYYYIIITYSDYMLIIIIYWHNIYLLIYVNIGNRLKSGTLYTDIVIIEVLMQTYMLMQ